MKVVGASAIGQLIEAHRTGDEEKFYIWANFIADSYEENGDVNAAKLIRNRISGTKTAVAVLDEGSKTDIPGHCRECTLKKKCGYVYSKHNRTPQCKKCLFTNWNHRNLPPEKDMKYAPMQKHYLLRLFTLQKQSLKKHISRKFCVPSVFIKMSLIFLVTLAMIWEVSLKKNNF